MNKPKRLIVIVGPTASGKTDLAIRIAQLLKTEIISADSRQFYQEMSIGTAKPSESQLTLVPHHFINNLSISTLYSCGDFERDAIKKCTELFEKHDDVICVGGSGLFIKSLCDGIDEMPEENLELRNKLNQTFENEGLVPLLEQLKVLDKAYFLKVDQHNSQRVIRALEVCITTGKAFSSFRTGKKIQRPFEILKIGLNIERQQLYARINQRVDEMVALGLEHEVRSLHPLKHLNALQTVGYNEFFDYFENKISKQQAIDLIKQNTRRYAKKQMTWFTKDLQINWLSPTDWEQIWWQIQR
ncbi:MAG: tRNA (adenosine(37)-N6)-dimethylallyltransferase MiaA [Bacteroidetes bacterium]|nr:MAG: tRNA (adenosine(37)-N6)-dimethylallyltransferase MiaA [Bacteroidota bacterium]